MKNKKSISVMSYVFAILFILVGFIIIVTAPEDAKITGIPLIFGAMAMIINGILSGIE